MHQSFSSFGFGAGAAGESLWEAVDQLRTGFEKRAGSRMARGDVRAAVLALLAEEPMHGYQIIREIERRSGGEWKPSAGSVYPALQMLADEGLISAEESNGRKTYALTDAGGEAVAAGEANAPWESSGQRAPKRHGALAQAGFELAQAAAQVGRTGNAEQVAEAVEVLEDARRRLYSILAQG
ncbi:PadR family transcriptional regulator [Leucobacter chromiiresistens]|uniref:PadR family transcriptional regulator n=1 Tax=Leucobacter chromiiresistens TaxID=1079994 RepID=A0A147EPB8_9MICO|nr:PadR family transcriptional regulator [Leucobacter chromiiresistens]KTR86329.1 PadR family transcriptional regulator [Leucobacter chromiiresistens]